ncbi:MAG: serine protease [Paracoccaceae bacterium]
MKTTFRAIWLICALALAGAAQAQQSVWVQIEAQPSLTEAEDRARVYAGILSDVNGFALHSGWYGIVLGPYDLPRAEAILRDLRAARQIPGDSFIADGRQFARQFWPVGGAFGMQTNPPAQNALPDPVVTAPLDTPLPQLPEGGPETLAESRAHEATLDRGAREMVQTALQWEGFYTTAIDGAFGPGTRRAIEAWQSANGQNPTGVLSTSQYDSLVGGYTTAMDSLGIELVHDADAGIEISLPMGLVEFDRYAPPFAHYTGRDDSGVQILLISQRGDQATLAGLYAVMQTLEIVPLEGPRDIRTNSFTLTGRNADIISHSHARLADGQIKGFTLVWPTGDEQRRSMVLAAMEQSFTPRAGVLPDSWADGSTDSIDLIAGLDIRRPDQAASGFYVDRAGRVLTALDNVAQCNKITLDDTHEAEIMARNGQLALLQPAATIAPAQIARFQSQMPRLQSEIAIAGYPYGGRLGAPVLTYGALAEMRGLDGAADVMRLALAALAGDAGGPVYDARGGVVGMLLPNGSEDRRLPADVRFAADAGSIAGFLAEHGITPAHADATADIHPEDLTRQASAMTVLVGCWN